MNPVIDFTWFYYIGRAKLCLTYKETGRLTMQMFNKLYDHYKDDWDMEMLMSRTRTTYKQAYNKAQEAEEWF